MDEDTRVCHCGLGIEDHYYGGAAEHSFTPIPDEEPPPYNPEQAFWDAISLDPADDAPRLIYADWLEENGEEQTALFIRYWVRYRHLYRECTHIAELYRSYRECMLMPRPKLSFNNSILFPIQLPVIWKG